MSDLIQLTRPRASQYPNIALTDEVTEAEEKSPAVRKQRAEDAARVCDLFLKHAPIAVGVSGGKDSIAAALAMAEARREFAHAGPFVLIHSDLGRVEWKDSLPTCERLAARLGAELIVVRRAAGDMMDRWLVRWANNLERYAALSCVKVILPWSTPSMRFCTSELKTAVMCRELIKRFPGRPILSASGVRRDESPKRKKKPVAKLQAKLRSVCHRTSGYDWNPIIEWTTPEVYKYLDEQRFQLHEAYRVYGSTRVSCAFCIMGSEHDLVASTKCVDNQDIYREMVGLEIDSTFAFQGDRWLGDVAPHLLTSDMREQLVIAKQKAELRQAIEEVIPDHLLYTDGWPTIMPTPAEAMILARVRRDIAALLGVQVACTTGPEVEARYAELMAEKAGDR